MQQALVLMGALGLVLMSCGPLRESPYKSSLFASRTGSTSRVSTCKVLFVPKDIAFAQTFPSILPASSTNEFGAKGTVRFELPGVPKTLDQCLIELDPYDPRLASCDAADLHSEAFVLELATVGNSNTLALHRQNDAKSPAIPCGLVAVIQVRAVPETVGSIRAQARAAAIAQWP